MTVALVLVGTASMAQNYIRPLPRPSITIQKWGNGMSTIRDNQGGRATVQQWPGGMTTIRGNQGNNVTCQTWTDGTITCR